MKSRRNAPSLVATALLAGFALACDDDRIAGPQVEALDHGALQIAAGPESQLGRAIFFDHNLSANRNQSCASCHDPAWGWTGPRSDINAAGAVYPGSFSDRFGNRKPPSASYATSSPILHFLFESSRDEEPLYVGGNFWDGRATGERLGNPAADQALGPFLNSVEQALPSSACIVARVCTASYPVSFTEVYGPDACPTTAQSAAIEAACTAGDVPVLSTELATLVATAYDRIGLAVAAFEASPEVNAFTSKFDAYQNGSVRLSKDEKLGLAMFKGKAKCSACHVLDPGPAGEPALFTDFTFDNIGVPANPQNPALLTDPGFIDLGLGDFLDRAGRAYAEANMGKQKVPTLRNVDLRPASGVKAYGHNGYFKSLEGIVHFYNTRDVKAECPGPYTEAQALAADCWPAPEVVENVNTDELGDLHLTPKQEAALVAFMRTLSDGWSGR